MSAGEGRSGIWPRLMLVSGLVLIVVAALVAFLPVPAQEVTVLGASEPFFCGPGNASEPAFVIWSDPASTTSGSATTNGFGQTIEALGASECVAAAQTRLFISLGLGVSGILLALAGPIALRYVVFGSAPAPPPAPTSYPTGSASPPPPPPDARRRRIGRRVLVGVAAALAAAVAALVLLVILPAVTSNTPAPVAKPSAASPPASEATPASSACTLAASGHDVRLSFTGPDAAAMCDRWQAADGSWIEAGSAPSTDTLVCSGSYEGVAWWVDDDLGMNYGNQACGALNQWAHGGGLSVP